MSAAQAARDEVLRTCRYWIGEALPSEKRDEIVASIDALTKGSGDE